MKLVRGIARNVEASAVVAEGAGAHVVGFELDGHSIRVEIGPDQPPCPIKDGDDVIVAGEGQGEAIVSYAYKDLTQGCLGRRSTRQDGAHAVFSLIIGGIFLWCASIANSDGALLLWTQRIFFYAFAGLLALFAAVNLMLIFEKFQAAFLVVRASIDTVRGVAREVTADDGVVRLELDGRRVQFAAPNDAVLEGDELVVAGEIAGDIVSLAAYRNVTRGIFGSAWSPWELVVPILMAGLTVAMLGLFWLDISEDDLDNVAKAVRWILTVMVALGLTVLALDRLFRWRLYLDAYRRVTYA